MATERIRFRDLTVGMVTAKDVYDISGRRLLGKGTVITPTLLRRLRSAFVDTPDRIMEVEGAAAPKVDQQAQVLLAAADQLHYAMAAIRSGKAPDMDRVETAVVAIAAQSKTSKGMWDFVETVWQDHEFLYYHSVAVAGLAASICHWAGFGDQDIVRASLAGYFHDIGKALAQDRTHPQKGEEVLRQHGQVSSEVLQGVAQHHEFLDGTGFPHGLKGEQVGMYGRIVAAANAFHHAALQEQGNGRCFLLPAAELLYQQAPAKYDVLVARALIDSLLNFYKGKSVRLTTGEEGVIVLLDPGKPSQPIVQTKNGARECGDDSRIYIQEVL